MAAGSDHNVRFAAVWWRWASGRLRSWLWSLGEVVLLLKASVFVPLEGWTRADGGGWLNHCVEERESAIGIRPLHTRSSQPRPFGAKTWGCRHIWSPRSKKKNIKNSCIELYFSTIGLYLKVCPTIPLEARNNATLFWAQNVFSILRYGHYKLTVVDITWLSVSEYQDIR